MAQFQVNQGTQTELLTGTITGGTLVGYSRLDVGTGATYSPWGGTTLSLQQLEKGTLTNLATGTINALASGTISGGTVQNLVSGTINALASGTVTGGTLTNLVSGTINALASGTVTGGTLQNLVSGTINALASGTITGGTLGNLASGSVVVTTGTVSVTVGTIVGPTASGGTPTTAPVLMAGTDATGTVYAPLITSGGLVKTLQTGGTLTLGTLTNLVSGTINALAAGTITAGTLTNLVSGTINALAAGTITGGTLTNLVSGTVNALAAGTITAGTLTNLVSGTINALATGTITGGTLGNLNYGTVQIDPAPKIITPLTFGTLGTAGGSFFGTLSAASGAGTKHYITGLSVIGQAGTADVRILAGTAIQGTGVLGAGNVVPGGGYVRDFAVPFATGTGSELTYHFVGAGSAFIIVNYWKGA